MSDYHPPLDDMLFLLTHVYSCDHQDLDADTIEAILDEAAKLARDQIAPLNHTGDQKGCYFSPDMGTVKTAEGFKEAYAAYRDNGWNAIPFPAEFGGQDLPWSFAFPVQEMWQAANMSFGLCPLLNQGAVEAIWQHGSDALKQAYLEKLISGEWTGTMNLTEPQAGSDLGLIKSTATAKDSNTYSISGQKIFITYGEHDLASNIVHLVLARLPDAPDDVKGISLFVVPKFLENGERNAVKCIGIEHKLGIHASPTCTMEFDGAEGYLVGKAHHGLKYMFTMMNNARLSVGLQGVAVADRATGHAIAYAAERVQGKDTKTGERISINHHPDVQRMILSMKAYTQAGRALTYQAATYLDNPEDAPFVDLLTPIVKSWCTDMAVHVTSLGIQIHGGMGFIEETGAAQYWRDSRILPIYEGTNGIQAQDLAFRKTLRDDGKTALLYLDDLQTHLPDIYSDDFSTPIMQLTQLIFDLIAKKEDTETIAFAAAPYLQAFGIIAAGALLARQVTFIEAHPDPDFVQDKKNVIDFYIRHILPQADGHLASAENSLT